MKNLPWSLSHRCHTGHSFWLLATSSPGCRNLRELPGYTGNGRVIWTVSCLCFWLWEPGEPLAVKVIILLVTFGSACKSLLWPGPTDNIDHEAINNFQFQAFSMGEQVLCPFLWYDIVVLNIPGFSWRSLGTRPFLLPKHV